MSTRLTLNEINKQLDKKDLNPDLKASLQQKKSILSKDKEVLKK
jgi:hypothetical protein